MGAILRYFIAASVDRDLLDLRATLTGYSTANQSAVVVGSSSVNVVWAAPGVDLDVRNQLGGEDVVFFNRNWADYSKSLGVSGAIVFSYLDVGTGLTERVTVLNGSTLMGQDKLVFADGSVITNNARSALLTNLNAAIGAVTGNNLAETSVNPGALVPVVAGGTLRGFGSVTVGAVEGVVFGMTQPGVSTILVGSTLVDKVYAREGSIVDARNLLGGQDVVYFTGSWGSYTKSLTAVSGAIVFERTVSGLTERITVLNGSTTMGQDKLVFADGAVISNNARSALLTNLNAAITSVVSYDSATTTPALVAKTIAELNQEFINTGVMPVAVSIADTTANLVSGGVVSSYIGSGVAVEVMDTITVADLALIDAANGGGALKYVSLTDTQANLSGSSYVVSGIAVTVTNAASVAQLTALDTANGTASVTATTITDTEANLFPGGVISAYIQSGVAVNVTGAISFAHLAAIDAANVAAAVTYDGLSGTLSEITTQIALAPNSLLGVAVTVTDAVSMQNMLDINGATGLVAPVATSIADTAANLAGYSQYITSGVNITVTDAITVAALGVIDAANGAGTLTYSLSDIQANLSGNAYIKSGVAVTVTSDATVAQLNVHNTANGTASVTATSITDSAANLATGLAFVTSGVVVNVTGTISLAALQTLDGANGGGALNYSAVSGTLSQINDVTLGAYVVSGVAVTVTDAASLADLSAIQAIAGVQPVATTLVDTAANLAPGGVASGYVTSGAAVTVSDAVSIDVLAALDAANGAGTLTANSIVDVAAKLAPGGVASSYIKAGVAVAVTDTISATHLAAINTASGTGALTYSGVTGTLAQVTPYVASNVTVTVTDAVTVQNLSTIQATSVIKPVATTISDTSANLVQDLIGGGTNYVADGVAVTVTDTVTLTNLTSIDTANGGASVTISSMTDTSGQLAIARNTLNLDGVVLTVTDAIALSEFVALDVANGTAGVTLGSASGISGTAGTADSLQLSNSLSSIDLGVYNQNGQPTLSGFEIFDMSADAGANVVRLTADGLFLQASDFFDATSGNRTLVINGGSNDTVYRPLVGDWAMQGTANTFDVSGAAGAGYSQYFVTHTGSGMVMEVLIQTGVVIL